MNNYSLLDSHAHLADPVLWDRKDEILQKAASSHVDFLVTIATSVTSLNNCLFLSQKYEFIKTAGCTPPHDVAQEGEKEFSIFEEAAKNNKLCAIGETGLDYHFFPDTKEIQKLFFIRYLHLANRYQLPVIIHCREAFSDLYPILRGENANSKIILHCFSGTQEEADRALERGYFLSFSGIITYPKNTSLRNVVKKVPIKQMLIETDCPYLAPQPYRGKINEPAYLFETAKEIATIKNISLEEVANTTTENGKKLFF